MFTLVGWYSSVDPAGAFVNLAGIADPHVTVSGNDILVPELNKLLGAYGCVDKTAAALARITSPSLLEDGFQEYLSVLDDVGTRVGYPLIHDRFSNPVELTPVEALQAQIATNPASATGQYVLAWLGDGPIASASGRIRTIRATASITLSAGTWVNGALTFPVSLKAGKYQIVGMRAQGTGLIAARLVIPGQFWRPGVIGTTSEEIPDFYAFRDGTMGVFGEFYHASPPTLDALGASGTSQEIWLDVIYLG